MGKGPKNFIKGAQGPLGKGGGAGVGVAGGADDMNTFNSNTFMWRTVQI